MRGDIADALGMPDEEDYEFIDGLVKAYEKKYPGELAKNKKEAQRAYEMKKVDSLGRRNKEAGSKRHAMQIPSDIYVKLKKHYPTIIGPNRSVKHVKWFLKKFPIFAASEKY